MSSLKPRATLPDYVEVSIKYGSFMIHNDPMFNNAFIIYMDDDENYLGVVEYDIVYGWQIPHASDFADFMVKGDTLADHLPELVNAILNNKHFLHQMQCYKSNQVKVLKNLLKSETRNTEIYKTCLENLEKETAF